MTGLRGSRVVIDSEPRDLWMRLPLLLLRDPSIKPGAKLAIQWLASQRADWVVYTSVGAQDMGVRRQTFAAWLDLACATSYVRREPTGEHDPQGHPTFVYHVSLDQPRTKTDRGQVRKAATKKINEEDPLSRTSAKHEATTAGPLPEDWAPNHTHARVAARRDLDIDQVAREFRYTQAAQENRQDWDRTFSAYLRAFPSEPWATA